MNTAESSLLLYDVSLPQQRYYELVEELRERVTAQVPDAGGSENKRASGGSLPLSTSVSLCLCVSVSSYNID
jgi:hypothetical protein